MLTTGLSLLTGTLLACLLPRAIDAWWISFLPICLYLAYMNTRWRLAWLVAGSFLWASGHVNEQLDQRLATELNNKRLIVIGEVITIPRITDVTTRFLLKPLEIENYEGKLPDAIRLNWRNPPVNLAAGQVWQLGVKLKRPHGYQNPGGFDYERWLFIKGIGATGYVLQAKNHILLGQNHFSIEGYRSILKDAIQRYCSGCENIGLLQALSIGYRGDIVPDQRQTLQQTGTAHLIAISGLHIGIIAAVFYAIGLAVWKLFLYRIGISRRGCALLVGWLAGFSYSLLAGFDLPAQRAMLMLTVILLTLWIRLPFNLLNSVMTALVCILIVSPLAVLSESFWLTFTALLTITLGSILLTKHKSRIKRLLLIQVLFSLLFIPISIVIFGQVHSASLLANLVAVPFVSFIIVPLNFILLTLLWLPSGWLEMLYRLVDGLLGLLIHYLHWLQDIGLDALHVADISVWRVFIIALFLLLLVLPRGLFVSSKLLFLLPLVIFWPRQPLSGDDLKMTVLDVGMGTSIVVQTRHHSLVYDFGPGNNRGYSLGSWVVLPYLRHEGIKQIDRIVISNSDQDHMGGLYAISQDLAYQQVISGTPEKVSAGLPDLGYVQDCHRQPDWFWDGVKFQFLSAGVNPSARENDRSCVLKISIGQKKILITGDIEARQENKLLGLQRAHLAADILVAPHHGSLTSSTPDFVDAVRARDVIFSTGYLNRWGFPRPTVVQRYLQSSARIYQTDTDGAITINCARGDCKLNRYRQRKPRIWY